VRRARARAGGCKKINENILRCAWFTRANACAFLIIAPERAQKYVIGIRLFVDDVVVHTHTIASR
jgi:hypothetical protein